MKHLYFRRAKRRSKVGEGESCRCGKPAARDGGMTGSKFGKGTFER